MLKRIVLLAAVIPLMAVSVPAHAQPLPVPYGWGDNDQGQLADGSNTRRTSLVDVDTGGSLKGKAISAIDANYANACALAEGRVYCWGDNAYGQLGTGTQTDANAPVPVNTDGVLNGRTVTKVSVGRNYACALADGRLFCWGNNLSGQLGDGTALNLRLLPVAMAPSGLDQTRITDVTTSDGFTCVLADGAPYCWGANTFGQLGDDTTNDRLIPQKVVTQGALLGKTIRSVQAGQFSVCALANDGIYCWGRNNSGQVGDGTFVTPRKVPTKTATIPGTISELSLGYESACALADGKAYCWGGNSFGQLADGSQVNRNVPTGVTGSVAGRTVTDISLGDLGGCALVDFQAHCWGNNQNGVLGTGLPQTPLKSTAVVPSSGLSAGKPLRSLATGNNFTVALSATVPASPAALSLAASPASVSATWATPQDDGGSPVSGYTASVAGGPSCTTAATACELAGLRPGQLVTVSVTATNAIGVSPAATAQVQIPKRTQRARNAKGQPPKRLKAKGLTVLTGSNARTNAGNLIKTKVTVKGSKKSSVKVLKQRKGKVSIRTSGVRGLRVTVRQSAPGTAEYLAFRKTTVYLNGKRR
jgi:alpha-tubulin suppressor-like RCC1 family protein